VPVSTARGSATTTTPAARTVALLGGSFNPPHVAHLMAAYWVLATRAVDEVWLLPAYSHPFGKALAPFEHRVRMCQLAVADLDAARVRVCADEADLARDPLSGRTARTLEHLVAKYAGTRFALVVGTDVVGETPKWYRWERVRELAEIVVVGRQGYAGAPDAAPLLPRISSTEIRERLERGEPVGDLVPRAVLRYVAEQGLYSR
jgi:nicotinate-nucleotide adenylyltransferase